jgi:hypothetical protein
VSPDFIFCAASSKVICGTILMWVSFGSLRALKKFASSIEILDYLEFAVVQRLNGSEISDLS